MLDVCFATIPHAPGYLISEHGELLSERRTGPTGKNRLTGKWHCVKGKAGEYGHVAVQLWIEGKVRIVGLHRLVLEAFVGPCPEGMECLHGDGNPENNYISNLRWGTHKENGLDRKKHGRKENAVRGSSHPHAKLSEENVAEIFALQRAGVSQVGIAKRFLVHQSAISRILARKRWQHLEHLGGE